MARELAEGHVVGDHTWSHPDLRRLGSDEIADELGRTAQTVADAAGVTPTHVRPPYGAVDEHVLQVLAARGEAAVLWDVDTEDWKNEDMAETTRRAVEGARPGAIVLMHDVHPTTVQALPGIVDQLRAAGYTLVTVPQILGDRRSGSARSRGRTSTRTRSGRGSGRCGQRCTRRESSRVPRQEPRRSRCGSTGDGSAR